MSGYRVLKSAAAQLEDIYDYSVRTWGTDQADRYLDGIFACFEGICARQILWRPISAEFGVTGYFVRYEQHLVFFKELGDGGVGIAAILHSRMDLANRLQDALSGDEA